MATITRGALRLAIAQELGFAGTGTASGGTASTLIDVNTPERRGEPNAYWNGGIIKLMSGTGASGYPERFISDWARATQTFSVAPNFATAPDATTVYEAYKKTFRPADYEREINNAITKGWPHIFDKDEDTSLTTAASTYAYTIPSTVNADWIYAIELQEVSSPATYPYTRIAYQIIRDDAGICYIQFGFLPPTNKTIRIRYVKQIATLGSETATMDALYADYVKAKAKALLYEKLLGSPMRPDRDQVIENIAAFERQATTALRAITRQMPNTWIRPALYPGM